MKKIIVILALCSLFACKTQTVYVPVKETHIERITERDTIVNVKLIPQYIEKVAKPSDTSRIENNFSFSLAWYDGYFLYHTLGVKDTVLEVEVKYIDRLQIDSIPYPVEVVKEKVVKGALTWGEKTLIYSGWVFWGCMILISGLFILKIR